MATQKLTFLAVPAGTRNIPSSRLRVYDVMPHLSKTFDVKIRSIHNLSFPFYARRFGFFSNPDIVFVQKIATDKVLKLIRQLKKKGVFVIYDIDDEIGVWQNMHEETMIKLADIVTVTSSHRKRRFQEKYKVIVEEIFTPIDNYEKALTVKIPKFEPFKSVITFGNDQNISPLLSLLETDAPHLSVHYIGAKKLDVKGSFIKWKLDDFLSDLARFPCCILYHPEGAERKTKSSARLITAMAIGLPTIAFYSMEYMKIYEEIGFPEMVVSTSEELLTQLQKLSSDAEYCRKIVHTSRDFVLKNYTPALFASILERFVLKEFKTWVAKKA